MANEEQLAILRQGVYEWNNWRDKNQDAKFDLSEADLSDANLSNANLSYVDMSEAILDAANLTGAFLREADLIGASLMEADLSGANLIGANLSGTNLQEANLIGTNLKETILSDADLGGANLSSAKLSKADLLGAHLENANLERADLNEADLFKADLGGVNLNNAELCRANLKKTNLSGANLSEANLQGANLTGANLSGVNLNEADLRNANLKEADLSGTELSEANLSEANLSATDLSHANLVGANINGATLSNSNIYGINVWDLKGEFKEQKDLIISPYLDSVITVDNIEIAQFIYLILNNEKIRDVINTLTSKTVLILGRFALPERKAILDALRNKLREYDLLPIVFDFDRPSDKDFTETVKTLAGLSYFVIADVTNPKSSPLELQATVPDYQIPFVPIIQEGENPFAMMIDLQKKYNWVLNTVSYDSHETLMEVLKPLIIDPAMKKRQELRLIKAQVPEIISAKEYLDNEKM